MKKKKHYLIGILFRMGLLFYVTQNMKKRSLSTYFTFFLIVSKPKRIKLRQNDHDNRTNERNERESRQSPTSYVPLTDEPPAFEVSRVGARS